MLKDICRSCIASIPTVKSRLPFWVLPAVVQLTYQSLTILSHYWVSARVSLQINPSRMLSSKAGFATCPTIDGSLAHGRFKRS
jgi:hypothetical protein